MEENELFRRVAPRFFEMVEALPRTGKPWAELTLSEQAIYKDRLVDILDVLLAREVG